jgi:hypothetical protein
MPSKRVAILLGRFLGARVLPRNLVLRPQGINQGMPARGEPLALTRRIKVCIPEKLYRKRRPNEDLPS